jgi:hypothetical protein
MSRRGEEAGTGENRRIAAAHVLSWKGYAPVSTWLLPFKRSDQSGGRGMAPLDDRSLQAFMALADCCAAMP